MHNPGLNDEFILNVKRGVFWRHIDYYGESIILADKKSN
jgi:hypothetical protein